MKQPGSRVVDKWPPGKPEWLGVRQSRVKDRLCSLPDPGTWASHLNLSFFKNCGKTYISYNFSFKCTVQLYWVHSRCCATIPIIHPQKVFSFQTETLYPLNTNVHSLSLQDLVPTILSVCKNLTALGTSYKWKYTVFIFLWQIYFTQHNVLWVHQHCSVCQNFISDIFIYLCAEWWWFIILQREYSKKQGWNTYSSVTEQVSER